MTGETSDDDLFDDMLLNDGFDGDMNDELAETIEEAQLAMAEARARLADVPAEVVITNHVMGLYELAAIHLSASPPDLVQSALAIDAVACLVDGLGDRLGEEAPTMRDALEQHPAGVRPDQGCGGRRAWPGRRTRVPDPTD